MLNPLNFLSKIIKSSNQKELDRLNKIVKEINSLEEEVIKMEDKSFPEKTNKFIKKITENKVSSFKSIEPDLEEIFLSFYKKRGKGVK